MGDTGSLILGFVIAILCTRLIQSSSMTSQPYLRNTPLFALGIVLVPVYDAIRVFSLRIWKGQSPFTADKTHIHHLLTGAGLSHSVSAKVISVMHAFVLMEVYWLNDMRPIFILFILIVTMALLTFLCINFHRLKKQKPDEDKQTIYELR